MSSSKQAWFYSPINSAIHFQLFLWNLKAFEGGGAYGDDAHIDNWAEKVFNQYSLK